MRSSRLRPRLRDPSNMLKNAIHNYKKNLLLLRWWSLQGSETDIRWHFSRFLDCPCIFIEINNGISGNLLKKGLCLTHGPFFVAIWPSSSDSLSKKPDRCGTSSHTKGKAEAILKPLLPKRRWWWKKDYSCLLTKANSIPFTRKLFLRVFSNIYKKDSFFYNSWTVYNR